MSNFTVEEINLMCVFDRQGKTELMEDIRRVMPHIKDSDMEELGEQVCEMRAELLVLLRCLTLDDGHADRHVGGHLGLGRVVERQNVRRVVTVAVRVVELVAFLLVDEADRHHRRKLAGARHPANHHGARRC